jgi:gamma-glutamyltranspeptidase / glutathione hydrolase
MRSALSLLLLPLAIAWISGCATAPPHPYAGGCVAADHETASRAGAEILAIGGNAVDAAVATSFTLSVVRPYSCGIGGGGFMVIYFSDEGLRAQQRLGRSVPRHIAINYREMAPAAAGPDYYERLSDAEASTRGGKAVAIPGTVAGLLSALDRYGTLDRATVLAPAIRAAEEGFLVDEHYISSTRELVRRFRERPEYRRRFAFVWERYLLEGDLRPGDRIIIPEQARIFRAIAQHGAAGFYEGEVADAIIAAIAQDGGDMTLDDLRSFIVEEVQPLSMFLFGHNIITMPPPSSGGLALLQTLMVFSAITGDDFDRDAPAPGRDAAPPPLHTLSTELGRFHPGFLHPLIEASKNAFADRARYLADPAFVPVPTSELLLNSVLFKQRYRPDRTLPPDQYGTPSLDPNSLPNDHGTSHFSIVDATGSAVSCTETINLEFGSLIAVSAFGFILNNEMDDFTTRRGQPNAFGLQQSELNLPQPGKRPLSSMTPTIAYDQRGNVRVVAGASGGPRIISATTQCLLAALLSPSASSEIILAAPRLHHQWSPDILYIEPARENSPFHSARIDGQDFLTWLIAQLESRGHAVRERTEIGNVQMIRRAPDGTWDPACDPRNGGRPAGVHAEVRSPRRTVEASP